MRFGRYRLYYNGALVGKSWSLRKIYELMANMVKCRYNKDRFKIEYTDVSFDL